MVSISLKFYKELQAHGADEVSSTSFSLGLLFLPQLLVTASHSEKVHDTEPLPLGLATLDSWLTKPGALDSHFP